MAIVRKIYFAVSPEINADKLATIEALEKEWQRTLPIVFSWYWKIFLHEGRFLSVSNKMDGKRVIGKTSTLPEVKLVSSMKQTMVRAIQGLCTAWASNASNAWSKMLNTHIEALRSSITGDMDAIRHQVLWINTHQFWCHHDAYVRAKWKEYSPTKDGTTTQWNPQSLRIARTWFDDQLHRGKRRKPSPEGIPITFHQNSFRWIDHPEAKTAWAKLHTHAWANISTTVMKTRVRLPIMYNAYWHRRTANATNIHKTATLEKRDGRWYLARTFELPKKTLVKNPMSTDILGLDMGLRQRLATSHGQLLGRGWMQYVVRWDTKAIALQQRLQKSGVKRLSQSKEYRNLMRRVRVATECGLQQALNYVIHTYTPETLVMEDLDLQQMQGPVSKPMARRLARMGTGIMKRHLALKAEEYGFAVEVVDPSYTSQMCHACGYTDKHNRVGDAFACGKCGHRDHADINAARNIKECFLDGTLAPEGARKRRTKSQLQARWIARQQACSSGVSGQDPCVIGHAPPRDGTLTQQHALPCAAATWEWFHPWPK